MSEIISLGDEDPEAPSVPEKGETLPISTHYHTVLIRSGPELNLATVTMDLSAALTASVAFHKDVQANKQTSVIVKKAFSEIKKAPQAHSKFSALRIDAWQAVLVIQ